MQCSYIMHYALLQLLAHEIGHNLGFYHDFDAHHGGQSSSCNQNNHIMSYGSSKDKWSTCSKKDFEARYLWVTETSYVSWCMEGRFKILNKNSILFHIVIYKNVFILKDLFLIPQFSIYFQTCRRYWKCLWW